MSLLKQEDRTRAFSSSRIVEVRPDIYQFLGEKPGSHVYLIRGRDKNVLIDTGTSSNFPYLVECLKYLGLKTKDIALVLLTHEHFDHIGAAAFFLKTAVIAAHRLAANKIELQDEFVTLAKYRDAGSKPFYAHVWLEDDTLINMGNYELRAIHTPGHTSGCICVYELTERLLFSGDTVFAGGTLSDIATSGNISDYVNSVERLSTLRIAELCPGHGRVSDTPEQDMKQAVVYARTMMEDSKVLFEAITPKKNSTPSSRVLSGRDETDGEKEAGK
jgi:glyoxylase-like metal-dependent hydrolase (beta-lactamase superfamily II)